MCPPLAAIGVAAASGTAAATTFGLGSALAIGSAVMSAQAQKGAARASRSAYNKGVDSSLRALTKQYSQARTRQSQEEQKIADEIMNVSRERRQKQSLSKLSSLESGVMGQSIDQLLEDFERQELEFQTKQDKNFAMYSNNLDDQLFEMQIGTRDKIENMKAKVIAPPSFAATALQIGAGVLGAYNESGLADEVKVANLTASNTVPGYMSSPYATGRV